MNTVWDLVVGYLAIGVNCELGLVQRYCGAEPLDLLRFGFMPLDGTIHQIDVGFAAFADLSTFAIELAKHGNEFMLREPTSRILLHTEKYAGQHTTEEVMRQESRRIPRLARKLAQELALGERVAVLCMDDPQTNQVAALQGALLRHGPVNLLVITQAPTPDDIGCVVQLGERLTMGYLDRVQPVGFARYPSLDIWLAIMRVTERKMQDFSVSVGSVERPVEADFDVPSTIEAHLFWRAQQAWRLGQHDAARALFAAYRQQFPDPNAFGCEFDTQYAMGE